VSDSRIVPPTEVTEKIETIRAQINVNRDLLEAVSLLRFREEAEIRWTRSVLTNRANALKETLDQLLRVRELYLQNRSEEAAKRQRGLIGLLLIDGVVKGKLKGNIAGENGEDLFS
jgi:hypothetical protein